MSAKDAIRAAQAEMVKRAGVTAVFDFRTFVAATPFEQDAEWTTSAETVVGVLSRKAVLSPTDGDGRRIRTRYTVDTNLLSAEPNTGTVVTIESQYYAVASVGIHGGALYQIELDGPTGTATVTADVTGPIFTSLVLNDGATTLTWTATADENSIRRIRYRQDFQPWTHANWTSSYITSHSGTTGEWGAGVWEVHIQGEDAAGVKGSWFSFGTATIAGNPA